MELTKLHKLQSIISILLQLHTDGGVVHSKFCSFILSLFATLLLLYFFLAVTSLKILLAHLMVPRSKISHSGVLLNM